MKSNLRWSALKLAACAVCLSASCRVEENIGTSDAAALDGAGDGSGYDASVDNSPPPGSYASCAALPPTCGNAANESCCTSPLVPSGGYNRGYDLAGDIPSGNATHPATLSTFRLDRYEVTVGRLRAFVSAGAGTQLHPPRERAGEHPRLPGSGWDPNWNSNLPADTAALISTLSCDATFQTWTDAPRGNENRPINCLSWYEAAAFCIWDGGFLPSEAQWNYVASAGPEQRAYPWSSPADSLTIDAAHASYFDGSDCIGDGMEDCAVTDFVPVGTKFLGNGRWGHSDLSGNVREWTMDWLAPYDSPCDDCANLIAATNRVLRGGSFGSNDDDLRSGARLGLRPSDHNSETGARCARLP